MGEKKSQNKKTITPAADKSNQQRSDYVIEGARVAGTPIKFADAKTKNAFLNKILRVQDGTGMPPSQKTTKKAKSS